MARLNDDAQWIVLMGFIVSFSLFFLALMLNQSTIVGQTTAEAVSEFPKEDIRGVRTMIIDSFFLTDDGGPSALENRTWVQGEIRTLALSRQEAAVNFSHVADVTDTMGNIHSIYYIHFNNGMSEYSETYTFP